MPHVDDVDRVRDALMKYAAEFFRDVRSPNDVYQRFGLAFKQLQKEFVAAAERGEISPAMAEVWTWYSNVVPAMLSVMFLRGPKWNTRELELQLNDAFVESLRRAATAPIRRGSAIETPDVDLPPTEGSLPH